MRGEEKRGKVREVEKRKKKGGGFFVGEGWETHKKESPVRALSVFPLILLTNSNPAL